MNELGSRINFKQLLDRYDEIRIPIIQRDYAQGRPEEKEIRDDFLQAIKVALNKPANDPSLPFNLDFIYGSVEGVDETQFLPLDGQQRLTTLFLLHWYLAWKDGKLESFTSIFKAKGKSRFSYSIRPSSTEFFDALVCFVPENAPQDVTTPLRDLITNQSWYFRSWRLDPTIQSSLFMLDAIHDQFASSFNWFERLSSEDQPVITFQLLQMENYGLSDDLYIKMNSRGKPLTPFETFKARYERELEEQSAIQPCDFFGPTKKVADYVAWRMDNAWTDLFWGYRDKASNQYDGAIMNVFCAVALVTRQPDSAQFLEDVERIRQEVRAPTYSDFHARNWLDEEFTWSLIRLLDAWSGEQGLQTILPDSHYFDEQAFFQKIVTTQKSLSYSEAIQFAAYVLFLRVNHGGYKDSQFQDWMRVVVNLSENTEYHRTEDLQRSIKSLRELLPNSKDILEYFAEAESSVSGFSRQQIEEERLKAQLIQKEESWAQVINRAETHGYFRGQIEFLLDYCGIKPGASIQGWDYECHREYQNKFQEYFNKASVMFDERGLKELPDFRWERALLSIGNYLLKKGHNHSFLVNGATEPGSWKRLLRGTEENGPQARAVLKQLLEKINPSPDLETQLDALIKGATNLEPWREALVRTPFSIRYCGFRCLRFDSSGQIYLLKKNRMNGRHAELFTYSLYHTLLADMVKFAPLKLEEYIDVSGAESEPHFFISFTKNAGLHQLSVRFDQNRFTIDYVSFGAELQKNVANELRDLGLIEGDTKRICLEDQKRVEAWLFTLRDRI